MMSVNSPLFWTRSLFLFPKGSGSCMRIRDTAESPPTSRSPQGVIFPGLPKRNGNAAVLLRTDAGLLRRHIPGSTAFGSCLSDMRSWSRATKPLSVLRQRSSAGGKLLLFTDRSLVAGSSGKPIGPHIAPTPKLTGLFLTAASSLRIRRHYSTCADRSHLSFYN